MKKYLITRELTNGQTGFFVGTKTDFNKELKHIGKAYKKLSIEVVEDE